MKFITRSLPKQLAAEMRERIASGAWQDRMPGSRQLVEEFGHCRETVKAAIAELLSTGDLESRGPRRAPVPVRQANAAQLQGTLLLWPSSSEMQQDTHTREVLRLLQERLPHPVQILEQPFFSQKTETIVAEILASGWRNVVVMGFAGEVSDRLVDAGIKVVALGGQTRPQKSFFVYITLQDLICGAFRQAFALGHRSVCFPIWRCGPDRIAYFRERIAEEYARAGLRHSPEFHAPITEEHSPAALHACLRALLRHTPPTAMISDGPEHWLATIAVAAEMGMRIPRDLSHITLRQEDLYEALPVSQAHFDFPSARKLVANVIRLLETAKQGKPRKVVSLQPVWVPGGTLAAPDRRR